MNRLKLIDMKKILTAIPAPWPAVVVLLAVLYLTLSPMPLPPQFLPTFFGWDKVAHFVMFGGLAAVVVFDVRRMTTARLRPAVAVAIIVAIIALGGAIELLQGTSLINRYCDFPDFIANSLGAIVGGTVAYKLVNRYF